MSRCRRCLTQNDNRKRLCGACGAKLPKRRRPKHMAALEHPYEFYVEINGGDHCGICLTPSSTARRLDRDHDHKANGGLGAPRGLLHARCNRALPSWVSPEWLEAAAAYLRRAQEHTG